MKKYPLYVHSLRMPLAYCGCPWRRLHVVQESGVGKHVSSFSPVSKNFFPFRFKLESLFFYYRSNHPTHPMPFHRMLIMQPNASLSSSSSSSSNSWLCHSFSFVPALFPQLYSQFSPKYAAASSYFSYIINIIIIA